MCRSIKVLRRPGEPATSDEVQQAARQFVRKISGFQKPSRANQEPFDRAIQEIAEASERLLQTIARNAPATAPREIAPALAAAGQNISFTES